MGSLKGVPHRKWTKEEKLRIVKMHLEDHIPILKIEKKEHVSNSLVSAWCKRYVEEGEAALEPHKGNKFSALHTSKSLSEIERLRLTILKQELELARLKKGYFVRGVGANKEYIIGKGQILKSSKPSK
jgi:transposase